MCYMNHAFHINTHVTGIKLYTYVHCVHTDHGMSVAMLLTWFPFLYFEMTFRFNYVPQYLLNISRPFAAHWYVYCVYIYISLYNDYNNNCMPTVLTQRPVFWCYNIKTFFPVNIQFYLFVCIELNV